MNPTTEMMDVALDRVIPNPWQPRQGFDPEYIAELQESILGVGLLQEPLARRQEGYFQLAFGHSRIEAVRGLHDRGEWGPTVRLKVSELSDEDMAYIALTENRARKNLTAAEEISAWAKVLREIEGVTMQSLADKVGVDRTTMSKNLAILDLPRGVLDLVDSGDMSVRAARELLCLRNDNHCHEDQIALVLHDVSGVSKYGDGKPPDYRVKTVRASIRALTRGYASYGYALEGYDEAAKNWRPLKEGVRAVSFDVAEFKKEFPDQIHVLPEGDVSGGAEWTCAAKAWGSWSGKASREATKAAKEGTAQAGKAETASNDGQWWKAVQKDPLIMEFVGKDLSAMKSVNYLSAEDRAALGTRIQPAAWGNAIQLPGEAQPKGITLKYDNAPKPPMFDFSECASCTTGAAWLVSSEGGQLACTNRQAYWDRASVGMEAWIQWKDAQVVRDDASDRIAIGRLSNLDPMDARGLVLSMWSFVEEANQVKPLSMSQGGSWEERARYFYYPAGAQSFIAVMDLQLPPLGADGWQRKNKWQDATDAFLADPPEGVDWALALACLLVWQARVTLGLGRDIWGTVARATVE